MYTDEETNPIRYSLAAGWASAATDAARRRTTAARRTIDFATVSLQKPVHRDGKGSLFVMTA
jgi:hypothetical protein